MEIKVLSDNTVYRDGIMAEHGLSFWLKYDGQQYIIDTGQGLVITQNAERMGINLAQIEGVIISHSHDDHLGGLDKILALNPAVKVYGHPAIKKTYQQRIKERSTGKKQVYGKPARIKNFIPAEKPLKIAAGLWLTGILPGEHNHKEARVENSLVCETGRGLVVLVGCSHAGIIKILNHIKSLSNKPVLAAAGGFHLYKKEMGELREIAQDFAETGVKIIYPLHCSGFMGRKMLQENCLAEVKLAAAGEDILL